MPTISKQRIIIVSELFYPDGTSTGHILTKISNHLADDYEIVVFTASQASEKILRKEKNQPFKGQEIIRIRGFKV